MKRKSFFLSLVFAMLFFLFGGNVNVQAETTLEPYTYINPVYKDVLSDALPEAVTPYSLETPQNVSYQMMYSSWQQPYATDAEPNNYDPSVLSFQYCNYSGFLGPAV